MQPSHPPSLIVVLAFAALIAWRMYARIRRMVGRQRLSTVRPWITIVLLPIVVIALGAAAFAHPQSVAALFVGAALGTGLGLYGLRLTAFERAPAGLFYTPNAHLGIALSLLLVLRIGYRMAQLYLGGIPLDRPPDDFIGSPLTLFIFGTLAGYYVSYAVGLLRWRTRVLAEPFAGSTARPADGLTGDPPTR
jgi:hypothetical protein